MESWSARATNLYGHSKLRQMKHSCKLLDLQTQP
ncbi:hypothetical protein M3J09_011334 [Ascochyta lentis]